MHMIVVILIGTLLFAREISGYDSRYNSSRYFVLHNKKIAKILLPKSSGFKRGVKRSSQDFNKMTYRGAILYLLNLLVILSMPIILFLVPEIRVQAFELETRYMYILVDTLNQKLPILFSLILLAVEIIFLFINAISQAKKQNQNWLVILSVILMVIGLLFGLLQVEELISTFMEVF